MNFSEFDIKIAMLKVKTLKREEWEKLKVKTDLKYFSNEEWRLFAISYLMEKVEQQNIEAKNGQATVSRI